MAAEAASLLALGLLLLALFGSLVLPLALPLPLQQRQRTVCMALSYVPLWCAAQPVCSVKFNITRQLQSKGWTDFLICQSSRRPFPFRCASPHSLGETLCSPSPCPFQSISVPTSQAQAPAATQSLPATSRIFKNCGIPELRGEAAVCGMQTFKQTLAHLGPPVCRHCCQC